MAVSSSSRSHVNKRTGIKAIAALVVISVGAAISGCETSPPARHFNLSSAQAFADSIADSTAPVSGSGSTPHSTLQFRTVEYSATVVNAGMPGAFTAFVTITRAVTVYPSSAARVDTAGKGMATFTTPSDRERWVAAGSPALAPASTGKPLSVPAGQFSFAPQGTPLTYREASHLPGIPSALSAQILSHLRPVAGPHPPGTLVLSQLGYLIAVAPLPVAARSAAWRVMASLPGLRLCGIGTDLSGERGEGLCLDAGGNETELLVSEQAGSVRAIEERLRNPSPLYPSVSSGSLIESITFSGS